MSLKNINAGSYCAGRLNFSIPDSFVPAQFVSGSFKLSGLAEDDESIEVLIEAVKIDKHLFQQRMRQRVTDLKRLGSGGVNILRHEDRLANGAVLFRVQEIEDAYFSELNFILGQNFVRLKLNSFAEGYIAAERDLINFFEKFEVNEFNKITCAGNCFCAGSLLIKGNYQEESARFLYRSNKGISVSINLDTYKQDENVSLLDRVSGSNSLLNKFGVKHKVLRARERTVAGMRAQEWLSWAEVGPDANQGSFGFAVETMRSKPDRYSPSLHISMDTGQTSEDRKLIPAEISDDEAIELWDFIVDSIRPFGPV